MCNLRVSCLLYYQTVIAFVISSLWRPGTCRATTLDDLDQLVQRRYLTDKDGSHQA